MGQHVWVRGTIVPITITSFVGNPEEGEIWFDYSITPDALSASEEEAAFGCDLCGAPLLPLTVSAECNGVPNDLETLLDR